MRAITAAIILGFAAASAAQSEPEMVRLASAVEPGRTLAYTIDQAIEIESAFVAARGPSDPAAPDAAPEPAGEGRLASMHHAAGIRLVPRQLERDGSGTLILMFDRIDIDSNATGEALAFHWVRSEAPAPVMPGQDPGAPARVGMILATTIPVVTIDAAGTVTSVVGLDPFLDEATTLGDAAPTFIGPFSPEGLAIITENILRADGAARVAVRAPGSVWRTVRTLPMPPAGDVRLTTDWSFTGAHDGVASLEGVTTPEIIAPEHSDRSRPSAAITDSHHTDSVRWDTASGALISRATEQSLTTRWTLGDQAVAQTQRVNIKIERSPSDRAEP